MANQQEVEQFLVHHGVLGMKWGQHKSKPEIVMVRKLKGGGEVVVTKDPTPPIAKALSAIFPGYKRAVAAQHHFTLRDSLGNSVGEASILEQKNHTLNLMWIGVNEKDRGKGYASAVISGVIKYAKDTKVKQLTLEVPGKSPDAAHIYEKAGFKSTGVIDGTAGDIWGGLTRMVYTIPNSEIKHTDIVMTTVMEYIMNELDTVSEEKGIQHAEKVDDFLAHYGMLGMKWGRHMAGRTESSHNAPKRSTPHPDHTERVALARNHTSTLSTPELKKLNDRLQTEKKYRELNTTSIKKGKKIALGTIAAIGSAVTLYGYIDSKAGKAAINAGKRAINKYVHHAIAIGP